MSALLRAERRIRGFSQYELAERLDRPQSFVSKVERDERRLDVAELLEVLSVLGCDPVSFLRKLQGLSPTILEHWELSAEDLTAVVEQNPSLRGMLLGYVAELKLSGLLEDHEDVTASHKDDDHDRRRKETGLSPTWANGSWLRSSRFRATRFVRRKRAGRARSRSMRAIVDLFDCQTGRRWRRHACLPGSFTFLPSICSRLKTCGASSSPGTASCPGQPITGTPQNSAATSWLLWSPYAGRRSRPSTPSHRVATRAGHLFRGAAE